MVIYDISLGKQALCKLKPHFLMLILAFNVCQKNNLASLPVMLFIVAAESRP